MAQIPVNTRAVGDPKGDYLLYLEDYVHTFIRKVYQEDSTQGKKREISLWGYEFEEQGRVYLVISGAIDQSLPAVSGERFFPSCYCIGQATIQEGTDTQIGLEITAPDGSKIVVRDFYIYYDQNEEMQNYLIEWNLTHNKGRIRTQSEDAVRFTRMTQACNREEARVSYLWNAMNLLSLGLMVCVAAFGIISVNNYHKMKDMENKIAYIMSMPQEALAAMSGQLYEEKGTWEEQLDNVVQTQDTTETTQEEDSLQKQAQLMQMTEVAQAAEEQQTYAENAQTQEAVVQDTAAPAMQYYIVQQGDTLRSISYRVYGTYDMVSAICAWNGIEDADSILYGQRLLLQTE